MRADLFHCLSSMAFPLIASTLRMRVGPENIAHTRHDTRQCCHRHRHRRRQGGPLPHYPPVRQRSLSVRLSLSHLKTKITEKSGTDTRQRERCYWTLSVPRSPSLQSQSFSVSSLSTSSSALSRSLALILTAPTPNLFHC